MPIPASRIIAACVTAYSVFTLWQAYRFGVIFNYRKLIDRKADPEMFRVTLFAHIFGGAFFAWVALGGDAHTFDTFMANAATFTRP